MLRRWNRADFTSSDGVERRAAVSPPATTDARPLGRYTHAVRVLTAHMDLDLTRTESRLAVRFLWAGGLLHFLVPGLLLWLASVAYDHVLDVRFDPQADAKRRVRLVGVAFVAAAILGRRRRD